MKRTYSKYFAKCSLPRQVSAQATGVLLAAAIAAPYAHAAEGDVLEEIVVTAQFRAENLQTTPIAITAVTADMLEQRSQTSVEEVAAQAPSVNLIRNAGANGPSIGASIRGIGQYDFNPAFEPGVGMYVDDVYYSTLTGATFDLLDVDRVEILRGPQGTLAGKNSIGGAVKFFSKQPKGDDTGSIAVTYGDYHRIDLRGTADVALVPDTLNLRISGVSKKRDGYIDILDYGCTHPGSGAPLGNMLQNCKQGTQSGVDYSGARAILLWHAHDNLDITLNADVTQDDSSPQGSVLRFANFPSRSYDSRYVVPSGAYYNYSTFLEAGGSGSFSGSVAPLQLSNVSTFHGWGSALNIDWRLSDKESLKSITAYRTYNSVFTADNDLSPTSESTSSNALDHRQFSQELRFNGSVGSIDYTLGGYYFNQQTTYYVDTIIWLQLPPGSLVNEIIGNDPVDADTEAAFAHAVWHLTDKLDLTAGLRYTKEAKTYTFHRLNRDGTVTSNPGLLPLEGLSSKFSGSKTDYRVSLDYKWTDNLMTYAEVSTGFKGGGIAARPSVPDQAIPFGPESLTAYELGVKSQFAGGRVRANAAVFYNDYKDIQLSFGYCPWSAVPNCNVTQNGGRADIKGAELELEVQPTHALSFDAAASYLDFKYKDVNPLALASGLNVDMTMPYTAKWKLSGGLQYMFDLGDAGSITPRVDAAYQSEVYADAVNTDYNRLPAYTLVNARLTWRSSDQHLSVAAEVTNLTDKYYYTNGADLRAALNLASAVPGAPRMWALTVKKDFGK